jgi:riboflavin kinase/FMN adenylyltransferase
MGVNGMMQRNAAELPVEEQARRALREGRPLDAARLLGRPWQVRALVKHGDARSRTIGFPTANLHLHEDEPLAFGIYAVRVAILTDEGAVQSRHDGVANFGIRPMFRTETPLLEVHLFDFSDDIYDRTLALDLLAWLRPEEKFESLDALVTQITADAQAARIILRKRV